MNPSSGEPDGVCGKDVCSSEQPAKPRNMNATRAHMMDIMQRWALSVIRTFQEERYRVANAHHLGAVVRMEAATSIGCAPSPSQPMLASDGFPGPTYGQGDILGVLNIDEEVLTVRRKASPCKLSARSAFLWKIIAISSQVVDLTFTIHDA